MKKLTIALTVIAHMMFSALHAQQGVGIGTTTPKAAFNVAENKTVLFGNDTSGAGAKLMWIPSKSAFRVGTIGPVQGDLNADSDAWNYDSIGLYSFATGRQNVAKWYGSVAIGTGNRSLNTNSIALGFNNIVHGISSVGGGEGNHISGNNSIAIGLANLVNTSSGYAFGKENTVNYNEAISIGSGNLNDQYYTYTVGDDNTAYGQGSIAIGRSNVTRGRFSVAIGLSNHSNSYFSTVLGAFNDTIAGSNSTTWIDADPLFMIGGGQGVSSRKNAMMILKNGKTGFGTNTPLALLHAKYNSQQANPQLMLEEAQDDYSRISFKNSNPGYWNIEAYTRQPNTDNDLARLNFYFSLNNYIFSLRGNGNAVLTGNLYQNSDERLKQNILPLKNSLSRLLLLSGYTYQWKDSSRGMEKQVGLLAQEVEKQFPELVLTDNEGKKSVAYGNMVPVLLQAIKEQQKQIDELRKLVDIRLNKE